MIVVYKNFFRNKMVNLSVQSIRKFVPASRVICLCLYKESPDEYLNQEPLHSSIEVVYKQTQFVNTNNQIQDHIDFTKTSGYQNIDNGKYFVEGYNYIYNMFSSSTEKILILSEDHFFTTGEVLNEVLVNDFDLAYAAWDSDTDANGSIICCRFSEIKNIFPLMLPQEPIERFLEKSLVLKVDPKRRYRIYNRKHLNYFGDGLYTNSSEVMQRELKQAKIL